MQRTPAQAGTIARSSGSWTGRPLAGATAALGLLRSDPALALFYILAVTQGGHFLEHVVQMVQIHLLGIPGPRAQGVVGALDLEWVHFIWNSAVLAGVIALVVAYPRNRWLWLTALLAGWHELEHTYILVTFLMTGVVGTPGLLSFGGALGGGLPLARPNLHFLYNLIETTPLILGFVHQLSAVRRDPALAGATSTESA
jgi:hypothetical protein